MDPRDFHALAKTLLQARRPAENRTAIGRAYYAAFNVALDHLWDSGFRIKRNHTAHGEVFRHLSWSGNSVVAGAGSQLNDLRGMRNNADYDLVKPGTDSDKTAAVWVATADKCITALDSEFGGTNRVAIVNSITDARGKVGGY